MASGVEMAGLALAVLPIFIEIAKAYSDGVETVFDVAIRSRWEERLGDFYFDFYIQLFYLEESMQSIRHFVASKSAKSDDVANTLQSFTLWNNNPHLEFRLRAYFVTENRFGAFSIVSKRILLLLHQLIKDETSRISANDRVSPTCSHEYLTHWPSIED
jgi:hypothetical protein